MPLKINIAALSDSLKFVRSHHLLLVVCVTVLLSSGGLGLTNPILSLYAREYGANTVFVGIFMTAFAVGRVIVTIPTGRLADRRGSRDLMVAGAALASLSALWLAFATNFPSLIVARLLEGIGSGLFMSAATVLVAQLSPPAERGRITSLFQGSIILGLTITPSIGGVLADSFGMRVPIIGFAVLHAAVVLLVLWRIPALRPAQMQTEPSEVQIKPEHQPASESAVRALLKDRDFVLIALVAFFVFVGRSGTRDTLLPLYGESIVGLGASALGFIFTLISLTNLIAIPFAGALADSMGRKPPILLGLILNGFALFILGFGTDYAGFVIAALLMGVAKGFSEPTSSIYVTDISSIGRYGAAFGLFLTLRDLGLLLGPVVLTGIADLGGLQMPYLLSGIAFVAVAGLFAIGARETLIKVNVVK